MKAYKLTTEQSENVKKQLLEIIGQLSLGEILSLPSMVQDVVKEKAEVHFSQEAYYKMGALIEACDNEIAWDGIVYRDEDNPHIFYVTDIIVYPQEVTGATVTTDDELYLNWLNSLDDETFNHRRFNGHSHVRMGVTPSTTDTTYREQSMLNINDFFIFGIFNKNGAFNFQIYDIENNLIYDNADVTFYTPEPDYSDWAKSVIKEKVKEKKYTYQATGGSCQQSQSAKNNTNVSSNANNKHTSYSNYQGHGYNERANGYGYYYD